MTIKGKIIQILPETSGVSKTSGQAWRKQEYVIETDERFPKRICFGVMNAKIDEFAIKLGQSYTVDLDIEGREYQGKWYHSINAWKVTTT